MTQSSKPLVKRPRRGRPPASEKVDRREALLKSAIKLFAGKGFSAVDLREISKDAGVTVGLIRHYFESKEGLIDAAIAIVTERLQVIFKQITGNIEASSGEEFIDIIAERHTDFLLPQYELLQFLKHLAIELPEQSQPIFRTYFSLLNSEIKELESRWGLNPNIDASWLTFMLMYIQLGPIFLSKQIEAILDIGSDNRDATLTRSATNTFILKHGIIGTKSPQK